MSDDKPVQSVTTDIGVGWVYANGDNQYAFVMNGTVNRVPVEAVVRATVIDGIYQWESADIRRLDKKSWEQAYPYGVSPAARSKIEAAAETAILHVAGEEFDRRGTLARRKVQIDYALERRERLVEAVQKAQAELDALDEDVRQMGLDIRRLSGRIAVDA